MWQRVGREPARTIRRTAGFVARINFVRSRDEFAYSRPSILAWPCSSRAWARRAHFATDHLIAMLRASPPIWSGCDLVPLPLPTSACRFLMFPY